MTSWSQIRRIGGAILLLALFASGAILLRKSFHSVDRGPLLNVDDSIPNVAVSLAEHGRYGFLASPTQGRHDVDRTHAFYNYGPLYFYVAAALTWLLGPSLTLYRMLHPFGLLAVVTACFFTLRRYSLAAPAVFAAGIIDLYFTTQSPFARPDIMVSVCVAMMLYFSARAIEYRGLWNWFAVGFFAISAAASHQIALAVVPAACAIWLWPAVATGDESDELFWKRNAPGLAGLLFGGAAAGLVYLTATDFRLRDLWILVTAGANQYHRSFYDAFTNEFATAWAGWIRWRFLLAALGFTSAAILCGASAFLPHRPRRQTLAIVMPPVVAAAFYQFSLGFYGNIIPGYAILSQVSTIWAVAAAAALLMAWTRERFGSRGKRLEAVALWMAAAAMIAVDVAWLRTPDYWETHSQSAASAGDYIRETEAPFPERGSVWGSLFFGLDAGNRTDLVQFVQMTGVVRDDFAVNRRAGVAPQFLALSGYETGMDFVRAARGLDTYVENFSTLFPGVRYRVSHLVYAPPYGMARDYQRLRGAQESGYEPPGIAVNDGAGRQWNRQTADPMPVRFVPTKAVNAKLSENSLNVDAQALSSWVAELPSGFYLIEAAIGSANPGRVNFIAATPGRYLYWTGSPDELALPVAPILPYEDRAFLLVDHLGGNLYLSLFGNSGSSTPGIQAISVRPVPVLRNRRDRVQPIGAPSSRGWQILNPNVALREEADGSVRIAGFAAANAPLIQSAPFVIPARRRIVLTLPAEAESGAIQVGVGDGLGHWLAPPVPAPRRIVFDSGVSTQAIIGIANSSLGTQQPTAIRLGQIMIEPAAPEGLYVDELMACRSIVFPKSPDCAK